MGRYTKIGYCHSTVNPLVGCAGCELWGKNNAPEDNHCYAATLVEKWAGKKGWPEAFDEPAFYLARLEKALRWGPPKAKDIKEKPWLEGLPRVTFLNDLGDSFTEGVDPEWSLPWLERMGEYHGLWLWLTKRPRTMARVFKDITVPDNFILGTTITREDNVARRRLFSLFSITKNGSEKGGLPHYWLSIEPMVGPVDLEQLALDVWEMPLSAVSEMIRWYGGSLWIACGGESGENRRPFDLDWARKLRDQCAEAEIDFFFKQVDQVLPIPEDLMVKTFPQEWAE